MVPKTLSLSKSGWTGFFSFIPESMVYLDNRMYSFNGGQIYIHEEGSVNTFYNTKYKSSIKTVLNENPVERKVFKTIAINGDTPWDVSISTDIQDAGFISQSMLEKKEGVWYAHIRVPNGLPLDISNDLRTMSVRDSIGIGESANLFTTTESVAVIFHTGLRISSQISCGDYIFGLNYEPLPTMHYLGVLSEVNFDDEQNESSIIINRTGVTVDPWTYEIFMIAVKNRAAESTGVVGQFCIVDMERVPDSSDEELFVIEAEVMRSNP